MNQKLVGQVETWDLSFIIEEMIPDEFKLFYPTGIPASGWRMRAEERRGEIILTAYMWPGNALQHDCIRMPILEYAVLQMNRQRKGNGYVSTEIYLAESSKEYGELSLLEGIERAFCEQFSSDVEGTLGDKLADVLCFESLLKELNLTENDVSFLYRAMCARHDLTTTLAYKSDGTVEVVENLTEDKEHATEIFTQYAKKIGVFLAERGYTLNRKLQNEL